MNLLETLIALDDAGVAFLFHDAEGSLYLFDQSLSAPSSVTETLLAAVDGNRRDLLVMTKPLPPSLRGPQRECT